MGTSQGHPDSPRLTSGIGRSRRRVITPWPSRSSPPSKRELNVEHRRWTSEADTRRDVFRWIAFYNHRRRHSALSYLSPADYEQRLESTTLQQIAA
jgi:transposase InsO family protein